MESRATGCNDSIVRICLKLFAVSWLLLGLVPSLAWAQYVDESKQEDGLHSHRPQRFAITGARIIPSIGAEIAQGAMVIDQGKIIAIGEVAKVAIPQGVPTYDLTGKTIYPGFIDAYHDVAVESEAGKQAYWNSRVRPELDIVDYLTAEMTDDSVRRQQGIVAMMYAPKGAIIDGTGAVASVGGSENPARRIIKEGIGQQAELTVSRGSRGGGYPSSPMGAVALARQAFYDAKWYQEAWKVVNANPSVERPEVNTSLAILGEVVAGDRSLFVETSNELFVLRADRFAREFGVGLVVLGSGREYRRLDEVAATGRAIICPLDFPKAPNVASLSEARSVSLETLMHWDHAPENPGRLAAAGVKLAFTTRGLESPGSFLKQVRTAVERGLSPTDALRALTVGAAEILGVQDQLGTLERGKLASFVVTDGELFDSKSKVTETWVAGVRYESKPEPASKIDAKWNLIVAASGEKSELNLNVEVKSLGGKYSIELVTQEKDDASKETEAAQPDAEKSDFPAESESADSDTTDPGTAKDEGTTDDLVEETEQPSKAGTDNPAKRGSGRGSKSKSPAKFDNIKLDGVVLSGTVQGKSLNEKGVARWSLIIDSVEGDSILGRFVWPDGTATGLTLNRMKAEVETSPETAPSDEAKPAEGEVETEEADAAKPEPEKPKKIEGKSKQASFAVNYPLGAFGQTELPKAEELVLFSNFTVWTSGSDGIIQGGSVLIGNGMIKAVYKAGEEFQIAEGTMVVQGDGRHLSPGIIDCHSHMATDSGVNESSQAITAEVRIGDLVDCNDMTIYRQLAGGTTSANILHGSANPIGGQNQVIKLRWGSGDEAMKFAQAPQGIKFALGENVKRSNGSQAQTRYPGSRMGVEQIIRDAFYSANEYRLQHRQWETQRTGLPPRIDLELKALAEIVEGTRWVHCHSYRQDEILALIRTLDDFGIQIGTFQHILEGYKVADAMKKHGAMASAFADWWAYKIEVADAIPYAGSLMHEQGVIVSFNSDDPELGRRLNHEAAKAVKYGGVEPDEALKFVTLNPARQLRVDQYVGSIEVGKHADVVVWTGSPLSTLSRVDQTWIDGGKYFDRQVEATTRTQMQAARQTLIQKILDTGSEMAAPGEDTDTDPSRFWPRYDEFCNAKGH